jgi:hypothetical protein
MADGTDEASIEESPLPAGAGDAEVDNDIDDENLAVDHDDDALLRFCSMSESSRHSGLCRVHWWLRNCTW